MSNLNSIYNYVQLSENLGTSGQPAPQAFQDIANAGYQTLINLAPSDVEGSIANEAELVAAAGMNYVYIPVIWKKPTIADWDAFVAAMEANKDKKVIVHCQVNMRASAFAMLYRHIKLGVDLEEAQAPMLEIWNPEHGHPAWVEFIEDVFAKEKA
jgi:uncharacterized protein (TIGR01244 family)